MIGVSDSGGLVGLNGGTVSTSYSTGSVSGSSYVGGLVGDNLATVRGSFWDVTSSGLTTSAAGTGMTTPEMQTEANFTSATTANGDMNPAWNFTSFWYMPSDAYPLLRAFTPSPPVTANDAATTHDGSMYRTGK